MSTEEKNLKNLYMLNFLAPVDVIRKNQNINKSIDENPLLKIY